MMPAAPQFRDLDGFMRAAWDGDIAAMQSFLDAFGKEHVDTPRGGEGDYTALMWAAKSGSAAAVNFLLDNGADVNYGDKAADTPLHMAAWLGNLDAMDALMRRGANLDARNGAGLSPGAFAVREGHPEAAERMEKFRRSAFDKSLQQIRHGVPKKLAAQLAHFRQGKPGGL